MISIVLFQKTGVKADIRNPLRYSVKLDHNDKVKSLCILQKTKL